MYNLTETIDDNPTNAAYGNDPCTLYLWGDEITGNPPIESTRTYIFDSAAVY